MLQLPNIFLKHPSMPVDKPAKSKMGKVSKKIFDNIINNVKSKTDVNQWKNSASVIKWFRGLREIDKHTIICFYIIEFYPSISEDLLKAALNFAKLHTTISQQDTDIIFHSRKSLLFDKGKPWIKREGNSLFHVMMGSHDAAEVRELVGIYVLNTLANKYDKNNIVLYRDDGLAAFKNTSGSKADKIKKDITRIFKDKPNDKPVYIHKQSNHPPNIIKNLPDSISRRVSAISHDKEIFIQAAPLYEEALKCNDYSENLHYCNKEPKKGKHNRT